MLVTQTQQGEQSNFASLRESAKYNPLHEAIDEEPAGSWIAEAKVDFASYLPPSPVCIKLKQIGN